MSSTPPLYGSSFIPHSGHSVDSPPDATAPHHAHHHSSESMGLESMRSTSNAIARDRAAMSKLVQGSEGMSDQMAAKKYQGIEYPFHQAALMGDVQAIRYWTNASNTAQFVQKVLNSRDACGATPFHKAAQGGNVDTLKMLIEAGANPDERKISDKKAFKGETALHDAARHGRLEAARFLLDKTTPQLDDDGLSPLHIAAEGVRPHGRALEGPELLRHIETMALLLSKFDVNERATDGSTPLFLAAQHGQTGLAEFLLQNRADPRITNSSGLTFLHAACHKGHVDMVKFLLANTSIGVNASDNNGISGLHAAVFNGHDKVVEVLLGVPGINVEAKCGGKGTPFEQHTPLEIAFKKGDVKVGKLLFEHGAIDVNRKDHKGDTMLYRAADKGDAEFVKMLLGIPGIDVNAKNKAGYTPLIVAANTGHADAMKFLLERKDIKVNEPDNGSSTALHHAANQGGMKVFNMLREDPRVNQEMRGLNGYTLLDFARLGKHPDVLEMLMREAG